MEYITIKELHDKLSELIKLHGEDLPLVEVCDEGIYFLKSLPIYRERGSIHGYAVEYQELKEHILFPSGFSIEELEKYNMLWGR